ncbi:MAG: periplasmic binding protein [Pseudonocardia sp.]|jgi:iron complex transport system substrate-binding protein|uniref:ABC transporter substrate-binding protein n=1 Tax=Pseudonocardia sp. TaxID=60912 RepID=UPI0026122BF4|nr:ABC transporter substrate-binding protein [Pseudonocardia sp.]MCU1630827.1 periplasmic binding protein [Pseudonocardia sp.]MDT7703872.1 iron complex transport system substrate-binding protein [Pseudonocardiales bacterium]
MRIASLLPAATEIVGALGLEQSLAAVTFECDDPPGIRERRPVVVDTALPPGLAPGEIDAIVTERVARGLPLYDLDREVLAGVAPDLILTQDLCRVCALPAGTVDEALDAIGITADVLSIDPHTLDDVLDSILAVGSRAGVPEVADRLVAGLRERLAAVRDAVAGRPVPRVLVLEWTDPPFLAGHWVPEMVHRAGGEAVGAVEGGRSVGAGWDVLPGADLVLVAPCGFGLGSAVAQAEEVRQRLPGLPVVAIDSASYVVRAGPRLVDGVEAIAWALHPDAVPAPPPGRVERIG